RGGAWDGGLFRIEERRRQPVIVAVRVHGETQAVLPEVVDATDPIGLVFGGGQSWQKQCRKDRDDGNDHQQFYQSEREVPFHRRAWSCPVGWTNGAVLELGLVRLVCKVNR